MNLRSPTFVILFAVSLIAAAGNMALQSVLPVGVRAHVLTALRFLERP